MSATPSFYITDFGASQDEANNAPFIQKALDAASRTGGIAHIPSGEWTTGTLRIHSNTTLVLDPGACLIGSTDLAHYPPNTDIFNPQNHKDLQPYHLIYAHNAVNIRIAGGGTIRGSGPAFWHPEREPGKFFVEITERPCPMVHFSNVSKLSIENITFEDSPGWTLHLFEVTDAKLDSVTIRNDMFGPNTDGFDITDCKRIRISNCDLVCGDDAIVLKSLGGFNEDIAISNCILQSNCSALKLGAQEALGTIRRVTMSNCIIRDSLRGISLYNVAGGLFEDIAFSNIVMECDREIDFVNPIHIDGSNHFIPERIVERTGRIHNVTIDNVICRSKARIIVTAKDYGAVKNIQLSNIQMIYPRVENKFEQARNARGIQFSPHNPNARAANATVVAENIEGLVLRDIWTNWPEDCDVPMHFFWAKDCKRVFVDCPVGQASQSSIEKYHFEASEVSARD